MLKLFIGIQYIGIIILIGEIVFITRQRISKIQNLLLVTTVTTLINYIGYLLEIKSDNMNSAIVAVKMIYLGKPFIILSIFFAIMEYCKVNIPKAFRYGLGIEHFIITMLVIGCDKNNLYYSSIGWTEGGLFPHLVLGHGLMYNVYIVQVAIYFLIISFTIFRRYRKGKAEYEKEPLRIMFTMVLVTIISYAVYLAGITGGYDTTLLGYLVSVCLLGVALFKSRLLDMTSLAKDLALDSHSEGIIVIDNDDVVLIANNKAEWVRKELGIAKISDFILQMENLIHDNEKLFINDQVYEIIKDSVERNGIKYGVMYTINNITTEFYYTERLSTDVAKKTLELVRIQHSVLAGFASIIEARDGITGLHIKNTSNYVNIIVAALKKYDIYSETVNDEFIEIVSEAAPLHDIGKISIPDAVLKKPGRLSEEEFSIIKTHTTEGAKIIKDTLASVEEDRYYDIAYKMAYYHHEKWDGSGYPCGLKGDAIPICARIMAIADVYDALRSKRSYKEGFSKEKSRNIILESSGTHFDPVIVDVFMKEIDKIEAV